MMGYAEGATKTSTKSVYRAPQNAFEKAGQGGVREPGVQLRPSKELDIGLV